MTKAFPFLSLPLELRSQIYSLYFSPADLVDRLEDEYTGTIIPCYKFDLRLFRVSKQIKAEAEDVLHRENVFISLSTPWPEAVLQNITQRFPLVASRAAAETVTFAKMKIQICRPVDADYEERGTMILLLDDLPLFCEVWRYSALDYPSLNSHLRLDLHLHNPRHPTSPQQPLPLHLQRRLLLPFGCVKGLSDFQIHGPCDEAVKQELIRQMAIPNPTAQECLEACAVLIEKGDFILLAAATDKTHAQAALETYFQAFSAIHIRIANRARHDQAELYFSDAGRITSGPFAGKLPFMVRIALRISLVARVVRAYLLLQQWEEAAFWGMRSVRLLRGQPEWFRAAKANEYGEMREPEVMIMLRTGIAARKMEEGGSGELGEYEGDCEGEGLLSAVLFGRAFLGLEEELRVKCMAECKEFGVWV